MRQMLVTEMDGRRQTLVASKCLSGGRETTAVTVASLKMPPDEIGCDGMEREVHLLKSFMIGVV